MPEMWVGRDSANQWPMLGTAAQRKSQYPGCISRSLLQTCAWKMSALLHQLSQELAESFPQWQEQPLPQAVLFTSVSIPSQSPVHL